jgi:hypothetical protein
MIQETFFNDLVLLPVYGFLALVALATLFLAIYFHELGHWLYFYIKVNKNIKIRFVYNSIWNFKWVAGEQSDYETLTDKQYYNVNMFGVLFGFLPIILMSFVLPMFLFIVIPYIFGCIGDLDRMSEVVKE